MPTITTKELGSINDQLSLEENLVAKFKYFASVTEDSALKNKFEQIASEHQSHFNRLYSHLQ